MKSKFEINKNLEQGPTQEIKERMNTCSIHPEEIKDRPHIFNRRQQTYKILFFMMMKGSKYPPLQHLRTPLSRSICTHVASFKSVHGIVGLLNGDFCLNQTYL